jgi:hypothetical protein
MQLMNAYNNTPPMHALKQQHVSYCYIYTFLLLFMFGSWTLASIAR